MNTTKTILEEAQEICDGDRSKQYGPPKECYERVAKMWSVVLGVEVSPRKVLLCMMCLKIARDVHSPKRDNLVDIAGSVWCADKVDADHDSLVQDPRIMKTEVQP